MSRLMSVSHTAEQVEARAKTVTRRLGWAMLREGDTLTLCRKVMGRKKGEPLERLAEVEVISVREERLWLIEAEDVAREGFPDWSVEEFVEFFCSAFKVQPWAVVRRIEWRFLDEQAAVPARCGCGFPDRHTNLPCSVRES